MQIVDLSLVQWCGSNKPTVRGSPYWSSSILRIALGSGDDSSENPVQSSEDETQHIKFT